MGWNPVTKKSLISCYNPEKATQYSSFIMPPVKVSHRVNSKGFDIIARKEFEQDE